MTGASKVQPLVSTAPLVSTQWLAERLDTPDLVVIDASWYLPAQNRDGKGEYLAGHIPGAIFFDIDAISDHSTDLPHMLPAPVTFASAMGALGVNEGMTAVVYDGAGLFSAARVWWMLRIFGISNAHVLDGGLPKWRNDGHSLEPGAVTRKPTVFKATFDGSAVASLDDVREALDTGAQKLLDARASPRFKGEAPEPRPGLPSGHMPGALNLPMSDLVADGRLRAPADLRNAFAKAGFDPAQPAITSCGSGVSAAIINLAMAVTGSPAPKLYDGSWTEWASRGMPVAKG